MPLSEAQKAQVLERDRQVWEVRCREHATVTAIAARLHIDHTTVCRSIARTRRRIAAAMVQDAEAHRAEQSGRIDHALMVLWEDYERSRVGKDGKPQPGSAKVMYRIIRLMEDQRKLWGLDAPPAPPQQNTTINLGIVNRLTPEDMAFLRGDRPPVRHNFDQIEVRGRRVDVGVAAGELCVVVAAGRDRTDLRIGGEASRQIHRTVRGHCGDVLGDRGDRQAHECDDRREDARGPARHSYS